MITLRIMRWEGDPGLSGWTLSDSMSALIRGRPDGTCDRREDNVSAGTRGGVMWPQAQEHQNPLEAGRLRINSH